jgi:predicted N-formylglutamate amidohydrolase
MISGVSDALRPAELITVTNRGGRGPYVILCDHASNRLLPEHGTLGLDAAALERHIAWDPGALPVSHMLAEQLDATLVAANLSRLVVDCNRSLDAPDLIPELSETTVIPGNRNLSRADRTERIELVHVPFHAAIEGLIDERLERGQETRLVSVHSFTPTYKRAARPWHIGILHDDDERLSRPMIEALRDVAGITVGDNQPYSPADRVYYTLERHGRLRGLPCAMIEIRNDEILQDSGQRLWAERLAGILSGIALEPDDRSERRVFKSA